LIPVLVVQGVCVGIGALTIRMINPALPVAGRPQQPTWGIITEGLGVVYRHKVILQTLIVNFISSIFNAGAMMTVFPFIIKRVYEGDAQLLATMMIVFFSSAMISNLFMLRIMPIRRPGRAFLILQLSRIFIVGLLWIKPDFWLLVVALIAWGLNMGITSTLARTIVQESAPAEFRARVMSVYSLGLLGSAPVGAVVLGLIIESFGTLNALLPAAMVSTMLFLYGVFFTSIFAYQSPHSGGKSATKGTA